MRSKRRDIKRKLRDDAQRLRSEGLSSAAIADELGLSLGRVKDLFRDLANESPPSCGRTLDDRIEGLGCGVCPECVASQAWAERAAHARSVASP